MSLTRASRSVLASRRSLLGAAVGGFAATTAGAQTVGAAVVGKDGWLFPLWDKVGPLNTPEVRQTTQIMGQAIGILRSAGIATTVALIPSKSRTYRQFLPDGMRVAPDTDRRYAAAIADYRAAGAITPDIDTPFRTRASGPDPIFFKSDTHWMPVGAEIAATETAKAVAQANVLPPSNRPGLQLGQPVAKTQPRGDLVRNLPEAQRASYAPERYQIREQVAGSSTLLADDAADVAMVGNSYSQPLYGFSSLLSNQLNRPVSLFWKPNNFGPYNILLSYLTSEGFKQQKPKMIVWVQLEWDIPALPTGSGWGQNAMPAEKFLGDVRRAVGA